MSAKSAGALVCGFSDLASGLGGVVWNLEGPGGLLLSDGEVVPVEAEINLDGEEATVSLRGEKLSVEAGLVPRTAPVALEPIGDETPSAAMRAAVCTATLHSENLGRTIQCPGHLSRWDSDPLNGAGTFRHLVIEGPNGSLLVACARGEQGIEGHGDERAHAWRLDAEGVASAFGEALISTQYDGDGSPTRLGLELWPVGEEQTLRAAATRPAGSRLGGSGEGNLSAALFRCHTDEAEGLGSYLLWRA